VLLDTRLRPCWMNRRASHLLGLNDGLCISREGLHANDRETDRHLQKILHLLRNKTISHTYLKVERRSRKPPLVIRTVPLQHSEQFFAAVPHAAFGVFIDTVDEHSIEPKYLAECFNFTNREAELAKLLISGQSLSACAMEMKIGIETARSHLDNLFSKSGTRRQGELISVLLRTLWRL
jgi:DNA-binding CsgD family transcriptional regulator